MGALKQTNQPRLLVRILAPIFTIVRRVVMPLIYVLNVPFILISGPSMHPLLLLVILMTTNALFSVVASLEFIIATVGILLEKSQLCETIQSWLRYCFCWLGRAYGKVFHGYTIYGLEHLIKCRAGLVVFYHMQMPLDVIYLSYDMYFKTGRMIGGVAHREMMGSWNFLLRYLKFSGSREGVIKDLKAGNIRAVAPGGERETVFSKDYELIWNGRIGFAKTAKELGIPIFPMFTSNGRESMPLSTYGFYDTFREVYETTKSYVWILLIMFPVKLRIYVGEPLYCRDDESAKDFAARVAKAIEKLRDTHQRKPGSLLLAFLERFQWR